MGKDGERRVLVNSRGRIQPQGEIEVIDPVPGRDPHDAGPGHSENRRSASRHDACGPRAVAVMDPNNGEILAMVSRPAFDPNIFSQRAKTPEGKEDS